MLAQQGKSKEELAEYIERGKKIADDLASLDTDLQSIQMELTKKLAVIPNMVLADVPFGKDDSENVEIKKYGDPFVPDFEVPYHTDIMEKLGVPVEKFKE